MESQALKFREVPELTGIRALAILIVFVSHTISPLVPGGLGVTIFFFLSGYLITSLLRSEAAQTGEISLKRFYIRRTLRIMPPLYVTLILSWFLWRWNILVMRAPDWPAVTSQWLYYSNYQRIWGPHRGWPSPLWSLAIEEHFYLVFPLLFGAVLMKMKARNAAWTCIGACFVVLLIRVIQGMQGTYWLQLNYFCTHTRIDSILWGCALALWNNPIMDEGAWKPSLWWFIGGCALVLVAALIQQPFFAETARYTLQGIGLYVIFGYVLTGHAITSLPLNNPIARWIGIWSYTIYLVHEEVHKIVRYWTHLSPVPTAAVSFAASCAVAMAMYVLIERPCAKLRRRLHRERAPRPIELQESNEPDPPAASNANNSKLQPF
jgi:peptidoglycan/LPS O-acetylase OafA/YrhL